MKIVKYFILAAAAVSLTVFGVVSCIRGGKLDSITITPDAPIIAIGTKQQFKATAHFTDGTTLTWTTAVNWTSSSPNMFNNVTGSFGLATSPTGTGTFTITATDPANGLSDTTTLIVENPISLTISPAKPFMAVGTTHQFTATALFPGETSSTQNITSFATWTTLKASIATVSSTGLVTAVAAGDTDLVSEYTYTDPNTNNVYKASGATTLIVTSSPLTSIAVMPADHETPVGTPVQFTAEGTFQDNTKTGPVTDSWIWTSSNADIPIISNMTGSNGLVTAGTSTGSTTITATDPITNVSGKTTLTVR